MKMTTRKVTVSIGPETKQTFDTRTEDVASIEARHTTIPLWAGWCASE